MVAHTCERCSKAFRHKSDLLRHAWRVTPCAPPREEPPSPEQAGDDRSSVMSTVQDEGEPAQDVAGNPAALPTRKARRLRVRSVGAEDTDFLLGMDYSQLRRAVGLQAAPETILRMVRQLLGRPENRNLRFVGPAEAEVLIWGGWVRMPVRRAVAEVAGNAVLTFHMLEPTYGPRMLKKGRVALEAFLERWEERLFRTDLADPEVVGLIDRAEAVLRAGGRALEVQLPAPAVDKHQRPDDAVVQPVVDV